MYLLLNSTHCVKSYGHFVKFWLFYDVRSPSMVISRDSRSKFRIFFNFVLILHLISGKVAKCLVEKLSVSTINVTGGGRGGGGLENIPRAFRVKLREIHITVHFDCMLQISHFTLVCFYHD